MFEPIRRRSLEANAPLLVKLDFSRAELKRLVSLCRERPDLRFSRAQASSGDDGPSSGHAALASRGFASPAPRKNVNQPLPPRATRYDLDLPAAPPVLAASSSAGSFPSKRKAPDSPASNAQGSVPNTGPGHAGPIGERRGNRVTTWKLSKPASSMADHFEESGRLVRTTRAFST